MASSRGQPTTPGHLAPLFFYLSLHWDANRLSSTLKLVGVQVARKVSKQEGTGWHKANNR